ncbi:MAG: hypothetical protein R3B69_00835 [Candidatus Paceibacterota bacterium]
MNLLFWGMTLGVIGKGMLALGVVWVHIQMANERSIDELVIRSFRTELIITLLGFFLIVLGYAMEVAFMGGFTYLLTCDGAACAASLGSLLSQ